MDVLIGKPVRMAGTREQLHGHRSPDQEETVSLHVEPNPRDERRCDHGARVTFAAVALVLAWPLAIMLIGFTFPPDGWTYTAAPEGQYRLRGLAAGYRSRGPPPSASLPIPRWIMG